MNLFVKMLAEYGLYLGIPSLFLAAVAWIYRSGARKRYEDDGKIPFREDEEVDKAGQRGH